MKQYHYEKLDQELNDENEGSTSTNDGSWSDSDDDGTPFSY